MWKRSWKRFGFVVRSSVSREGERGADSSHTSPGTGPHSHLPEFLLSPCRRVPGVARSGWRPRTGVLSPRRDRLRAGDRLISSERLFYWKPCRKCPVANLGSRCLVIRCVKNFQGAHLRTIIHREFGLFILRTVLWNRAFVRTFFPLGWPGTGPTPDIGCAAGDLTRPFPNQDIL